MLTATEAWDEAALALLIAAATGLGADLKAGLYTNVISPAKDLTLSDLTEPTYGSYARQVVVMGSVRRDPQNGICAVSDSLTWQQTGTPEPVIIQGIFYATGATPYLLGIEPFDGPVALNDLLDAFETVLEYVESNTSQGFTTVIR